MSFAEHARHDSRPTNRRIEMTDTETRTHISHVGTVMVPVSDQDRAIEFYLDTLGFEKRTDMPFGEGDRWVEVAPAGAATTIALVTPRNEFQPGIMTNVAFSSKDIDADHAGLLAKGVDADAEILRPGDPVPPMFFFGDRDGNRFLMVQEG
jgi:catechol 2,3-dioxygenase-like lactoylglutathione lyase family enzyme